MERIVIFGATGDLAGRYLMPALARLYEAGELPPGIRITGRPATSTTPALSRT